ncbi:hypothetical protein KXD96_15460 [Mycobacterium sp. SMC-2]|uniref:hypothetical protein n=1 Tax=Mycobacterium sp. SMC-2 TaxID=2857058 RepID=UPI0021B28CDF|nr:hypothetical protein [Mycobacterium sp. SMC-2]UXA04425.1 hypothetical protein KXD96_15460 [Mycobacterium sp. SMC-2]
MHIEATTIDTTPTLIHTSNYQSTARIIQNSGDVPVFVGDESVSADGATPALTLAPGATVTIPGGGCTLYGVVASGTGSVTVLAAGSSGG